MDGDGDGVPCEGQHCNWIVTMEHYENIASAPDHETGHRYWQAHVRALKANGLSRREYRRRHHLSYHALTC